MNLFWMIAATAAGGAFGAAYFGGLWLTVRSLSTMDQPALWLMVSFVCRVSIVLTGFYYVMGGRWEQLLACMAGFLIARTVLIRRLRITGHVSNLPNA